MRSGRYGVSVSVAPRINVLSELFARMAGIILEVFKQGYLMTPDRTEFALIRMIVRGEHDIDREALVDALRAVRVSTWQPTRDIVREMRP